MRELKKLLVGFLLFLFSFVGWAAQPTIKEKRLFKEAYGLYWSGKADLALRILQKRKEYKSPYIYYLMGLCYEYVGDYEKAVKFLGKTWRDFKLHKYTVAAATEEAAIRAYIFENPIGASVALELAKEKLIKGKTSKRDLCIIVYNLWYVKKEAFLSAEKEKKFLMTNCKELFSENEIENKSEHNTDNNTGG